MHARRSGSTFLLLLWPVRSPRLPAAAWVDAVGKPGAAQQGGRGGREGGKDGASSRNRDVTRPAFPSTAAPQTTCAHRSSAQKGRCRWVRGRVGVGAQGHHCTGGARWPAATLACDGTAARRRRKSGPRSECCRVRRVFVALASHREQSRPLQRDPCRGRLATN